MGPNQCWRLGSWPNTISVCKGPRRIVALSSNGDSSPNVNVPDNVTKAGALWKLNSSLAGLLHIWNRDLRLSGLHKGCSQGCYSCPPIFDQPPSRRVCVNDHLMASRNYSIVIRTISTKTSLQPMLLLGSPEIAKTESKWLPMSP